MTAATNGLVILHVTAPARVGGLERVVEALCAGHLRAGHTVHVAAVVEHSEDAERFLGPLAARGIHPHPLVLPGRAYLRERAALRDLCRAIHPTVVHTHGYRADVLASGVARQANIATITTVHGFTGGGWKNRLYEELQVHTFLNFDAAVAVSAPLATLLLRRGVPSKTLAVVVNAWSPLAPPLDRTAARRRLGLDPDTFCVAWVGRLTREKGADVLLEAIPTLGADISVSFIGDGRERPMLQERARQLGVAERIRWHGVIHDAAALLPAFDVFVLSSRTEGTPIALFEAMSAGIPIVATRVGGVPDVVTDADALLVPSENPAALADAIRRVRTDRVGGASRAQAARRRLEQSFAVAPWLAAYERLYRAIARPA